MKHILADLQSIATKTPCKTLWADEVESLEHAKAGRRMRTILAVQRALKRWCESRDAMPAVAQTPPGPAATEPDGRWEEKCGERPF